MPSARSFCATPSATWPPRSSGRGSARNGRRGARWQRRQASVQGWALSHTRKFVKCGCPFTLNDFPHARGHLTCRGVTTSKETRFPTRARATKCATLHPSRHLDESQRAMGGAKLANIRFGTFVKNQHEGPANLPTPLVSQSAAADLLNVSDRSIRSTRLSLFLA